MPIEIINRTMEEKQMMICSNHPDVRGIFIQQEKVIGNEKYCGVIERTDGVKLFVKENNVSKEVILSKFEFNFVDVEPLITIEGKICLTFNSFMAIKDSDSSSGIACGL